ncbi:MAG: hypothetical protein QW057_09340, partial [Candidatus Bathyarchaeia archaeon]
WKPLSPASQQPEALRPEAPKNHQNPIVEWTVFYPRAELEPERSLDKGPGVFVTSTTACEAPL